VTSGLSNGNFTVGENGTAVFKSTISPEKTTVFRRCGATPAKLMLMAELALLIGNIKAEYFNPVLQKAELSIPVANINNKSIY